MNCVQSPEAIVDKIWEVYKSVAKFSDSDVETVFSAVKNRRGEVRQVVESLRTVSSSILEEALAIIKEEKTARKPASADPNADLLEDDEETTLPDDRLFEDVPATGSLTAPKSMLGPAFFPPKMPQPPAQC